MTDKYILTKLTRITHPSGDIIKGLKSSDESLKCFGESYYSWVRSGTKKAWRYHNEITNNFVVLSGYLNINVISHGNQAKSIPIKSSQDLMVTLYPNTWYGFEAIGDEDVLIHNITDKVYCESEIKRKNISEFDGRWFL
jgi:hypothetical protein